MNMRFLILTTLISSTGCATGLGQHTTRISEQMRVRFVSADLDGDGRLNREEARVGMPWVYRNFDAIDSGRTGYISTGQLQQYVSNRGPRGLPLRGGSAP